MPKTIMDWFGVAALWLGGALFAVKQASLSLTPGAPEFLASGLWSYAPLLLLTIAVVAFLVALRRSRSGAPAASVAGPSAHLHPSRKAEAMFVSKWKHDTPLSEALSYIIERTNWQRRHSTASMEDLLDEVTGRLVSGQLTGWGSPHPDEAPYQIHSHSWNRAAIDPDRDYAFLPSESLALYNVSFAMGEVETIWPPTQAASR